MSSTGRFRRLPPVCAVFAVLRGLVGRLALERRYVGTELVMEDGRHFRVFRHLAASGAGAEAEGSCAVFVVRFRFARLPDRLNRWLSLIPVPLIGGYPGFRHKLWMADQQSGFWQGVYEWESADAVEAYRRSFVLRLMNRRAEPESIFCTVMGGMSLADFVERRTAEHGPSSRREGVAEGADEPARHRSPGGAR